MKMSELITSLAAETRDYVGGQLAQLRAELTARIEEVRGQEGPQGPRGEPGMAGPRGEVGLTGERGEKGEPGKDGANGRDGRDGKDGRDGIATTDELHALVDAKLTAILAPAIQNAIDAYAATLPNIEYRGVYREGETYARGNFATWAGSLWHCNAPTTEKPGEGSKVWTLAVKKGRDGASSAR